MAMSDLRTPKYLSPSSLACAERDMEEFFYRYICPKDVRPEKPPQTDPMSVGSAFDALVKAELYQDYYGRGQAEADGYTRTQLIGYQCEEHTLPYSLVLACDVFDQYKECGAYDNCFAMMNRSPKRPRMEFDLVAEVGGVPLLGKPDLHFHTEGGCHIITDWKVSGACSRHGVSPQQGYQIALAVNGGRGIGEAHKRYEPGFVCGLPVNRNPMNATTDYWADQLATYAWALGEEVGSQQFICRIEQLACRPCPAKDPSDRLRVKCCVHQSTVDEAYQKHLLVRYQNVWEAVSSGHYFRDLSREGSDANVEHLIRQATNPSFPLPAMNSLSAPVLGDSNVQ